MANGKHCKELNRTTIMFYELGGLSKIGDTPKTITKNKNRSNKNE